MIGSFFAAPLYACVSLDPVEARIDLVAFPADFSCLLNDSFALSNPLGSLGIALIFFFSTLFSLSFANISPTTAFLFFSPNLS